MNAVLLKALVALVPIGILAPWALFAFLRARTVASGTVQPRQRPEGDELLAPHDVWQQDRLVGGPPDSPAHIPLGPSARGRVGVGKHPIDREESAVQLVPNWRTWNRS